MPRRLTFDSGGVRLSAIDFGGDGPPVLLLHGLAGYAGEWSETAEWLSKRARVVALDARGHGASERVPADMSAAANVTDAAFVIESLELDRVVVVGQSLGALTAMLLAAELPDLVRGLVVVEAEPGDGEQERADQIVSGTRDSLRRWPTPFASREAAVEFFGSLGWNADVWTDGLEYRDGGWWPCFEIDVLVRRLGDAVARSYWNEWERSTCPALVVRGTDGWLNTADAASMIQRRPHTMLRVVEDAGHDVHLDNPVGWRRAMTEFLDSLDVPARHTN